MKSKRTIATDISREVRKIVCERDKRSETTCCVFCGSAYNLQLAHFVARSSGGLGVEQNLGCACYVCHSKLDQSLHRKEMLEQFERYLKRHYKDWNKDDLIYRKGE